MTKKLEMVFTTDQGKSVGISLADPKESLTKAAVEAVMAKIIEKNVFVNKNGKLAAIKECNIQTSDKAPVA